MQSDFQSDWVPEIIQHDRHASCLDVTLLSSISNVLNTNMYGCVRLEIYGAFGLCVKSSDLILPLENMLYYTAYG